tara:strand:+ start:2984 stop:3232 length:249 start_codon:yes stop_codon:yes gene_type:complete
MPTYKFLNNTTGKEYEEFMSISALDVYLQENSNVTQLVNGAPSIGDSVRLGIRKPDSSFRDILKNVKKEHSRGVTRSTVNTF